MSGYRKSSKGKSKKFEKSDSEPGIYTPTDIKLSEELAKLGHTPFSEIMKQRKAEQRARKK